MNKERNFIEVENVLGQVDKVELIGKINSERDDSVYAILTSDEIIGEEVNIHIGKYYSENGKEFIEIIEDDEEINYVMSLMEKIGSEK